MHELAIAIELVDLAEGEARRHGDVRVLAVRVRLGPLAGVVEDALRFSFDVAAAGTVLEGARLEIEHQPLMVWCGPCGQAGEPTTRWERRCPFCDSPAPQLVSGDALELLSIEICDHAPTDR